MLIKCGWQYRNEIGGNRVVKQELSLLHAACKRVAHNPFNLLHPLKLIKKSARGLQLARETRNILLQRPDLHDLFGIQEIGGNYIIQDKMIPLASVLGRSHASDAKVIAHYFEFVSQMVGRGLFEYTFNFLDNYGFNRAGHIRLIDVGEFSLNRDALISKIENGEAKPRHLTIFKGKSLVAQFLNLHNSTYERDNVLRLWNTLSQPIDLPYTIDSVDLA